MSYQVLANKYRPTRFEHLIGQKPTVDTLCYALKNEALHHAYIFSGTRGIGKTSSARIFAMALNCQHGDIEPCGQCESCQQIKLGKDVDVIEIDAASRSKVDEIRDILEHMHYPPTKGKYKIYLIDEIHMLSTHSFNALLKTVESPPSFVKFLFATTDPQKIPKTVHSRCIEFKLKAFTPAEIAQRLDVILTKESIEPCSDGTQLIAKTAQGSMRDAITLLDQCIAHGQGTLTLKTVQNLLGYASDDLIDAMIDSLNGGQVDHLTELVAQIEQSQMAVDQVIYQLMRKIHQHIRTDLMSNSSTSVEQYQLYYQMCEQAQANLMWQPTPYLGLEMLLLRMHSFKLNPFSLQQLIGQLPTEQSSPTSKPTKSVPEMSNPVKDVADTIAQVELKGLAKQIVDQANITQSGSSIRIAVPKTMESMLNDRIVSQIKQAYQQKYANTEIVTESIEADVGTQKPVVEKSETKPELSKNINSLAKSLDANIESVEVMSES